MSLKSTIENDLKAAFLGGDRFVSETLKGLKAAILNQEIAKNKREEGLSETEISELIQKECKKRKEAAEIYQQAGRNELAQKELDELAVIERYLPKQLTEDEIEQVVRQVIDELGLTIEPKSQGIIIGNVKKRVGASAESSLIARVVADVIKQN